MENISITRKQITAYYLTEYADWIVGSPLLLRMRQGRPHGVNAFDSSGWPWRRQERDADRTAERIDPSLTESDRYYGHADTGNPDNPNV